MTVTAESPPFDSRMLAVDGDHRLYVEQAGNPDGIPVLFLHGGPGSGCQPAHRRLFDPAWFRIILFDQRGAGRSTPKRSLAGNTTQHLVADMERIRREFSIERWMLVGGSWGALLATAYAEAFPERVTAVALRAVFLGSAEEADWAFVRGPQTFYPDFWRHFVDLLPISERGDPLRAYGARLMHPDPAVHRPAAFVWHDYERALSMLNPGSVALPQSLDKPAGTRDTPNTPFLEWHYISHDCFLRPGELLAGADRLRGIPGIIVQGRYDLLCPPVTADALARRWETCDLRLITAAGHSMAEPEIHRNLTAAIDELGQRLARGLA
ncbi:prolyl aminopeptidase [Rhodospirillaceae bacterium SYSU D60014]|uniref:prolyl aminopeptidase n=1 Tax=Virgifigura deserti TaxID=2268457 RepID=UPI000E6670BF